MKKVLFGLCFSLVVSSSHADDLQNVIYFGAGSSSGDGVTESDSTPFTIGFLRRGQEDRFSWGLDVAQEGTMIDSTYNRDSSVEAGFSLNLLVGSSSSISDKSYLDYGLLVGALEDSNSCDQQSYLGYQCYADESPNASYSFNYGAYLHYSYGSLMLGSRVTGESTQFLIGLRY